MSERIIALNQIELVFHDTDDVEHRQPLTDVPIVGLLADGENAEANPYEFVGVSINGGPLELGDAYAVVYLEDPSTEHQRLEDLGYDGVLGLIDLDPDASTSDDEATLDHVVAL